MYSFSARHVLRYLRNITFKVTSLFFYTYKFVMDGCISVQSFTCFACAHYAKHDMKPVGSNMMINFRCGKSCFYNKTLTLFSLQNQFVLLPAVFQLSLIFQLPGVRRLTATTSNAARYMLLDQFMHEWCTSL